MNTSFKPLLTDEEIVNLRIEIRKLNGKRDKLAIEIAKIQNMPNRWSLEMVDWDDPNISHIKPTFMKISDEITILDEEIREAEAIRDNNYDYYTAEKKVYSFLNRLPLETAARYLKDLGMTTHALIGEVAQNPNFIGDTYRREKYES